MKHCSDKNLNVIYVSVFFNFYIITYNLAYNF